MILVATVGMSSSVAKQAESKIDWSSKAQGFSSTHCKELAKEAPASSRYCNIQNPQHLPQMIYNTVKGRLNSKYAKHASEITNSVLAEARKHQFDPKFLLAIIQTESSFNPTTIGGHGEIGLMQIKPDTAEWIANKYGIPFSGKESLKNPADNIRIGAAYFAHLRNQFGKKSKYYISAYNMGPNKLKSFIKVSKTPNEYMGKVLAHYVKIGKSVNTSVTSVNYISAVNKAF